MKKANSSCKSCHILLIAALVVASLWLLISFIFVGGGNDTKPQSNYTLAGQTETPQAANFETVVLEKFCDGLITLTESAPKINLIQMDACLKHPDPICISQSAAIARYCRGEGDKECHRWFYVSDFNDPDCVDLAQWTDPADSQRFCGDAQSLEDIKRLRFDLADAAANYPRASGSFWSAIYIRNRATSVDKPSGYRFLPAEGDYRHIEDGVCVGPCRDNQE